MANQIVIDFPKTSINSLSLAAAQQGDKSLLLRNPGVQFPGGAAQSITINSYATDYSGCNFTITGTDIYGAAQSEVLTGPGVDSTVVSVNIYNRIYSIVGSTYVTSSTGVSVGNTGTGQTIWQCLDNYRRGKWSLSGAITNASNGDIAVATLVTLDPYPFTAAPNSFTPVDSISGQNLSNISNNILFNINYPVSAIKFDITLNDSGLTITLLQQGVN